MRRLVILGLALLCAACAPMPAEEASPFEEQSSVSAHTGSTVSATEQSALQAISPADVLTWSATGSTHTLLVFLTPGSPYARTYGQTLLPQVMRQFGSGSLQVQVAFVPFERYPQTADATAALLCAIAQGKGMAALPLLLQNPSVFAAPKADGSGIVDMKAMKTCLADPLLPARVQHHAALASTLNVTLVPTAFLDGERQVGLPEWADLRAWIEAGVTP